MCLAQEPQHSDAGEARTRGPSVSSQVLGPPGVLRISGEWLFTFRELGSTSNFFRGAREQAHNFRDLGSLVKKQKKLRKSLHFV